MDELEAVGQSLTRSAGLSGDSVEPMTEPVPAVAPLLRLLDGLDVAVFACDAAGVVGAANAAARSVLPGLATGEPAARVRVPELTAALAVGLDAFECECQGRVLVGMRTTGADGWMVWQVRDLTADRAREDALVAERTRNAFLIWAGRRLGGSLNPARTERAIVDLAVELGDAATLVLPHGRGGYRWRHVRSPASGWRTPTSRARPRPRSSRCPATGCPRPPWSSGARPRPAPSTTRSARR
jgi:hypothetical protein